MRWYYGLLALAGGAAAGATVGAIAYPDNRSYGAAVGAASGLSLTGVMAVGGLVSSETRAAAATAVIPVAALMVASTVACKGACERIGP